MNILFNLIAVQPIHNAKFHGGGSYGEILFKALVQEISENNIAKLFAVFDSRKFLREELINLCKNNKIQLLDINDKTPQQIINDFEIDTFYTPLFSLEKKWNIQVERFLFTWHGVRALEMHYSFDSFKFAQKFSQKLEALIRYRESWKKYFYKPKYNEIANKIKEKKAFAITVSEHSKASIQAFFPQLLSVEIPVFYSPLECSPQIFEGPLPQGIEEKKYFLLTSGARYEKNNLRAVLAFDALLSSFENYSKIQEMKMVITGANAPKIYKKKIKHIENFIFLNYVENDVLEALHQKAYAFIFPSLNEGFGYPPIQSMHYSVPVAASGTTSIPEVCGDAALYFDPYSTSEIKNRLLQLLDAHIYNEYQKRAQKRYQEVSIRQQEDLKKAVNFILKK